MKKLISFYLAVSVGWLSITMPARAFAPVAVLAAPQVVSASGLSYAMGALAGIVGLTGMYLEIKDATDNSARIPITDAPTPIPAPVAPATKPTSTSYTSQFSTVPYPSQQEACTAAFNSLSSNPGNCATGKCKYQLCSSSPCLYTSYDPSSAPNCSVSNFVQINSSSGQCSAGYSNVGGSCQLTNARLATDDKKCDIILSNGAFALAADLNCPTTANGQTLVPLIRDGKVLAYGQSSSGNPLLFEVQKTGTAITIKQHEQLQTATQTQVKTTSYTVDSPTGTITGVQTQTSPGTITTPAPATLPTATDPATQPTSPTNTPTPQTEPSKAIDITTCGLPGSPACAIDDTSFGGKDNFSTPKLTDISNNNDGLKTQLENSGSYVPSLEWSWLPSLLPGQATTCQPIPLNISFSHGLLSGFSVSKSLDVCPYLEAPRQILGYLLFLATIFFVWRAFTRSNEGV